VCSHEQVYTDLRVSCLDLRDARLARFQSLRKRCLGQMRPLSPLADALRQRELDLDELLFRARESEEFLYRADLPASRLEPSVPTRVRQRGGDSLL